MKEKSYAVIGLGQFGMTLALTLAEANCDVLAIDDTEENIQDIAEKVTYAVKADVREPDILESLGVRNVDVAVIAVAENMEASITATMQAKELGVPFVMAKAMNTLHGRILSKIGADKVIYPEHAMGIRVAKNLLSGGFLDLVEVSPDFSMAEFKVPSEWVGKKLINLKIREKYNINLVGIKEGEKVNVNLRPDEVFTAGCTVIAIGKNEDLNKVSKIEDIRMITSVNNGQVKNIIQLNQKTKARREQGLFVAEGRKMFGEAPREWISRVYVSEELSTDEALMEQVEKLPYEIVAANVFRQMSDTQTPQGIMTVLKKPSYTIEDILKGENPLVMVLEDLQDPGNAGTILRTGEGAGVSGVLLTKTCVDITNPKVIRSTMGSIYRMPFLYVENVLSLKQELAKRNIRTFAAHLKGRNSYEQENYTGGTAFFIGNEGNGLTEEAAEAADCLIRIPMCGKVESLNAAMASGILMYEAARQRRL